VSEEQAAAGPAPAAPGAAPGLVRLRRAALTVWAAGLVAYVVFSGVPINRRTDLAIIVAGLAASSIGRRGVVVVLLDFAPLFALLILYAYLHGAADGLGMPTHWHAQLHIDRRCSSAASPPSGCRSI
jgi:hypothetical protein